MEYDLKPVQQRCYLRSVEITGELGQQSEKYEFGYYNINSLPLVGNKSIDFWGYYNGVWRSDTTTLVPYQTVETTRSHHHLSSKNYWDGTFDVEDFKLHIGSPLSRETNEEYMRNGSLKSITYPTGSKDVFEYEAHRYYDENARGIRLAGGLRIKNISTISNNAPIRVRSFRYGQEENGLGYSPISSNPEYFVYEQTKHYIEPVTLMSGSELLEEELITYIPNEVISARHRTFFSNPIKPNTYNGGSSVMYDYVTEYDGTPENNNGKTVYHFDIDTDTLSASVWTMERNDDKHYWKHGQLMDKETFKNTNGKYTLVERIKNQYDTKIGNFGTSRVLEAFLNNVIEGDETKRMDLAQANSRIQTEVNVGAKVLAKTTKSLYDEKGSVSSSNTQDYSYGNSAPLLLRNVQNTQSNGTKISTSYKYPEDFAEEVYKNMAGNNVLPIVQTEYTSSNKYMSFKTPYIQLESGCFLPKSKDASYNSTLAPKERLSYKYNKYGNKIEETKDDKEHVAYLYGYNHQEIVAIIENATYSEVAAILGTSTIEDLENAIDSSKQGYVFEQLRKQLPQARVYTYQYKPLVGITAMTDPDGQTTYFEYDELGRLAMSYQIHDGKKEMLKNCHYKYKTEK